MHRTPPLHPLALALSLLAIPPLAGCPRAVMPSTQAPAITGIHAEPLRPSASPGVVAVFSQDVLVVTGSGWLAADAQVRVGTRVLQVRPESTDTQLRVDVPSELGDGNVVVLSRGQVSPPSAQQVVNLGPGHVQTPRLSATMEPQIDLLSAGTGSAHCVIAGDGGVPCDVVNGPDGVYAAAFRFKGQPRVLFSLVEPAAQQTRVLFPLPATQSLDWVTAIEPFTVDTGYVPDTDIDATGTLAVGAVRTDQGTFESALVLNGVSLGFSVPPAPFILRHGRDRFGLVSRMEGHDRVVLVRPDDLFPSGDDFNVDVTTLPGVNVPGVAVAIGVVEAGWGPGTDELVGLSCDSSGGMGTGGREDGGPTGVPSPSTVSLFRVNLDAALPAQVTATPLVTAGAGDGCDQLCSWGALFRAVPLEPDVVAFLPPPALAAQNGFVQGFPLCVLNDAFSTAPELRRVNGQRGAITATAVHMATGEGRLVFTPADGNGRPARQLRTWTRSQGIAAFAVPRVYGALLPNGNDGEFFGVPLDGTRVDLYDRSLQLRDSTSVLGAPSSVRAIPDRGELRAGVLALYPGQLYHLDATGLVRGTFPAGDQWTLPIIEDDVEGAPVATWVKEDPMPGMMRLRRVRLVPDGFAEDPQPLEVALPMGAQANLVAVTPQWILLGMIVDDVATSAAQPPTGCGAVGFQMYLARVPRTGGALVPVDGSCGSAAYAEAKVDARSGQVYVARDSSSGAGSAGAGTNVLSADGSVSSAEQDWYPVAVAPMPSGGAIGLFVSVTDGSESLGGFNATGGFYRIQPASFFEPSVAVSPDTRRLYIGTEGTVTEYELTLSDPVKGEYDARVRSRTPVPGRVTSLAVSSRGDKVLFVLPDQAAVGIIE